jgi:hypothetical protein
MAEHSTLLTTWRRKRASLRKIADTEMRVSAPAGGIVYFGGFWESLFYGVFLSCSAFSSSSSVCMFFMPINTSTPFSGSLNEVGGWGRASPALRLTSLSPPTFFPVMPKTQSFTLRQPAERLSPNPKSRAWPENQVRAIVLSRSVQIGTSFLDIQFKHSA